MTVAPPRSRLAALALVAAFGVACTPANEACAAPSVTLEATVTDTSMDPSDLTVCRDQDVRLEVSAETDGTFHIHGYDDQVPAVSLEPGDVTVLEFTADTSGQFIIELHAHDGGDESEIGVLTVNEP
jgi:hypothetical protein